MFKTIKLRDIYLNNYTFYKIEKESPEDFLKIQKEHLNEWIVPTLGAGMSRVIGIYENKEDILESILEIEVFDLSKTILQNWSNHII